MEPTEAPVLVALLGASNLWMALPSAVRHLLLRVGSRPLRLFVADGFGRSYGMEAGVMGLRFPGLVHCGLFSAIEESKRNTPSAEILGLLTDIGNDIIYGAGVRNVCRWIRECVARLQNLGATVAITSLPIAGIASLPSWRYRLLRSIFYPGQTILQDDLNRSLVAVQSELEALQAEQQITLLPTQPGWYTLDRFHLRPRASKQAMGIWIDALTQFRFGAAAGQGNDTTVPALSFYLRRPAEYSFYGRRHKTQTSERTLSPNAVVRFY
jgi:hypothetical protein